MGKEYSMEKYVRKSFEVKAVKYEVDKGLEDGFIPWSQVITNGWTVTDGLIKVTRPDGILICPFIKNRRGMIFLREGDYIIEESDFERHVCGESKFFSRFQKVD